ncbi:hypothetical protein Golax_010208 [Gossypium laxum]|uniref:DUF4283 domain-containing protein n=1 Tax=Gossypium laxum TaxID=34288 RepID=A0A7J8ZGJ3_9ROSI|nr:hypothetical protein [Gossypium laxum]
MRNTMANLCHLLGVQISDLGNKRYLFKFFYEVDVERVLSGTPWTFNTHLLLLHRLRKGEDPKLVPLEAYVGKKIPKNSIRTILLELTERREEICNKKILAAANRMVSMFQLLILEKDRVLDEMEEVWSLELVKNVRSNQNLPWMIYSDFNEILYMFEKEEGLPRKDGCMMEFRETKHDEMRKRKRGFRFEAWWVESVIDFTLWGLVYKDRWREPRKEQKRMNRFDGLENDNGQLITDSKELANSAKRTTFNEEEAERILCIPFPYAPQKDRLVWRGEASGEYSVTCTKNRGGALEITGGIVRKITFDAAFHKQSNRSCSGIVVRDSSGRVLNFTMRLNEHIPTDFETEAITCVQAAQLRLDLGLGKVEIEGNALSVIKKVQSGKIYKSGISAYVLSTKMLSSGYEACVFKNKVAHAFAVEGLKRVEVTYPQNGFPQSAAMEAEEDNRRILLKE